MSQRYTQREVGRILGVEANRLRYWERLRLVRSEARWGTRFYSFGDLVALRSIQRLTQNRIPARRLRLAVTLIEQQLGASPVPLQELRLLGRGREVLVIPPGSARPFNPLKQQWVLPFESSPQLPKLHSMIDRSPSQLFEMALNCETRLESLPQAVDIYRRVLALAPDWIDARINLGVALYQLGRIDEARVEFYSAVELDPLNGVSHYNLGCVLEEQGEIDEAIEHLQRAARAMPTHADVHFNLALAYEQSGVRRMAREEWMQYLRLAPGGPWAGQARVRLKQLSSRRKQSTPIPFRRPS